MIASAVHRRQAYSMSQQWLRLFWFNLAGSHTVNPYVICHKALHLNLHPNPYNKPLHCIAIVCCESIVAKILINVSLHRQCVICTLHYYHIHMRKPQSHQQQLPESINVDVSPRCQLALSRVYQNIVRTWALCSRIGNWFCAVFVCGSPQFQINTHKNKTMSRCFVCWCAEEVRTALAQFHCTCNRSLRPNGMHYGWHDHCLHLSAKILLLICPMKRHC